MDNLTRLKLHLNNKEYFTDTEYTQFLEESGLDADEEYEHANDVKEMLETVLTVLQSLANDLDSFRKIETEFVTTTAAAQYIEKRISSIRGEIDRIDALEKAEGSTNVTGYFFFNGYNSSSDE